MEYRRFTSIPMVVAVLTVLAALVPAVGEDSFHSSEFESKVHDEVKDGIVQESGDTIEVIVEVDGTGDASSQMEEIEGLGNITGDLGVISSFVVEVPVEKIDEMAQSGFVESVNPVYPIKVFLQDSTPLINATVAWDQIVSSQNLTGRGVGICVIDTGVNYTHPDLGGCASASNINTAGCSRVVGGYDFVNDDNNPMDDHGHGTHVAGIVGANGGIRGVAPESSLVAIKVLDSSGNGNTADLVSGINWCINNATLLNISVISMSLGTESVFSSYCDNDDPSVAAAIDAAVVRNISVVVATGNLGSTTGISDPACIRNSTAVGSSTNLDSVSSFTNRNSLTDLLGPGSGINSTRMQGGYVEEDGTSMAAPHVSGMLAILYQKYKILYNITSSVSFFEDIGKSSGVKVSDSGTGLVFARIDVFNSSQQIRSTFSSQVSGNMTAERGSQVNLSALWSSNVDLGTAVISTNETGSPVNISGAYGSPLSLSGTSDTSSFSWSNSSLGNGTFVTWSVYANDSVGNTNVTGSMNFTVVDTSIYVTNLTQPSGVVYSPSAFYTFNATLTDFTGVDTVMFEWNSSENATAYVSQPLNSSSATYTANKTGLSFGNYTYRWIANDTLGNLNSVSASGTNIVSRAPTSTSLFLNGTQSNSTYDRSSTVNITASLNATSVGNVSVTVNISGSTTELNSSADSVSYSLSTSGLAVGSYNVTAVYNGSNSNYSQSGATLFFFVREFYRNSSVSIQNGTLETINATQINMTLDFLTNDTAINNETNVSVGSDNPVGSSPSGISMGKFIRINVSSRIADNLTYAVIRFSYADSEVPSGAAENTLRLFRWNGSFWNRFDGQFVGGVDTSSNVVFANTTQFSEFTIAGEAESVASPVPSQSSSGGGGGGIPAKKVNVSAAKVNETIATIASSDNKTGVIVEPENTTKSDSNSTSPGNPEPADPFNLGHVGAAAAVFVGVTLFFLFIWSRAARLMERRRRPWSSGRSSMHFHKNSRRRRPS